VNGWPFLFPGNSIFEYSAKSLGWALLNGVQWPGFLEFNGRDAARRQSLDRRTPDCLLSCFCRITRKADFKGTPMPPESNERPAWKDTIKTYAGYVTRIIQKFDLPEGNAGSARAGVPVRLALPHPGARRQ
jgi:hypothetical protein